jgi:hypothetical protein
MMKVLAAMVWLGMTTAALGEGPAFDPRAHRDFAGPATEVLVLGTPHLSGLPDSFTIDSLAPVLDRLAAWRPDIITIEGLSGPECELLRRYKALYGSAFDDYCWDLAPAEKATGLDVVAATAEAAKLLAAWPADPTAAQRRYLAAVFVASGDRASALVQWLRLVPAERHEGDGLDGALVAILEKARAGRNENYALAATLAARLGLERVHPVDDHTADLIQADLGPDYEAAILKVWSGPATAARRAELKAEEAKLGGPQATLAYYRYHNRPRIAADAFAGDFGAALKDPSPQHYGRHYVGWWEVRNLRMVANIRAAFARHPGARVLTIVGSSHKGYFEAYLAMMHDVRLADAEKLLK